jgi:hypothetical protein
VQRVKAPSPGFVVKYRDSPLREDRRVCHANVANIKLNVHKENLAFRRPPFFINSSRLFISPRFEKFLLNFQFSPWV